MTSSTARFNRTVLLAGLLGLGAAGISGPALSESGGDAGAGQSAPAGEAPPAMQKLQAKRQEIQQLTQRLRKIQKNATQANPDLKAVQKEYRDLVVNAMSSGDYDPNAEVERIRALQSELQSSGGDLADDERQAKSQELQQKKQQFRRKQQEAMQDEAVQTARLELDEKMKSAMKEQNPNAGEILAQLNQLQQEYKSLLQKAIQQQQGGNASGQGNQG